MSTNTKTVETFLTALQNGEYDAPAPKTKVHVHVCIMQSGTCARMYYAVTQLWARMIYSVLADAFGTDKCVLFVEVSLKQDCHDREGFVTSLIIGFTLCCTSLR